MKSVSTVHPNPHWDRFYRLYQAAGKPTNHHDWARAAKRFFKYDEDTQETIVLWAAEMMLTVWRTPEYTPLPENALKSEGWTRMAPERTIPRGAGEALRLAKHLEEQRKRGLR